MNFCAAWTSAVIMAGSFVRSWWPAHPTEIGNVFYPGFR
jgi:hypothetical protein